MVLNFSTFSNFVRKSTDRKEPSAARNTHIKTIRQPAPPKNNLLKRQGALRPYPEPLLQAPLFRAEHKPRPPAVAAAAFIGVPQSQKLSDLYMVSILCTWLCVEKCTQPGGFLEAIHPGRHRVLGTTEARTNPTAPLYGRLVTTHPIRLLSGVGFEKIVRKRK